MSDPIQFPTEMPLNSLRILLDFGRQRQPWNQSTLAAACTVVLYGVTLAVPAPAGAGEAEDPVSAIESVIENADSPEAFTGVVPWALIISWAAKILIENLLK